MSKSFRHRVSNIIDRLVGYELDKAESEYAYSARVGNSNQRAFDRLRRLTSTLDDLGRVGKRIAEAKGLPTDSEWDDQLAGGKADGKAPSDFDEKELQKGQKVELEHTDDYDLALEIASDHLVESPDYYKELDKMEKKLKEKKAEVSQNSVSSLYDQMKELDNSSGGVFWRFQPKDATLDHKSMSYTDVDIDTDGIWAYGMLDRALESLTDSSGSYMEQVRRDSGGEGELVAIKGASVIDDAEDFFLIQGGKIVARFDPSPFEALDRWDLKDMLYKDAKKKLKSEDAPMGNQTIGDNPLMSPTNEELSPLDKSLNAPSRRPGPYAKRS